MANICTAISVNIRTLVIVDCVILCVCVLVHYKIANTISIFYHRFASVGVFWAQLQLFSFDVAYIYAQKPAQCIQIYV